MKDAEKQKWLTLYECTQKIGAFEPWERFSEDCCFTYICKGQNLFYSFLGESIGKCGIACYIGEKNYLAARKRLTAPNPKKEPAFFLQDGFVCIWDDRDAIEKADYDIIRELGFRFRGKGCWLHFDRYETGYVPVPISADDVDFMIEAFGNLHMMMRAIYEEKLDPHFDEGYKLVRWYDPKKELYFTHYFKVDISEAILKPPVIKLGNEPFLTKVKEMSASDISVQVDWSYLRIVYRDEKNRETFPLLLLGADSQTGVVLFETVLPPENDKISSVLNSVSGYIDDSGKPKEFAVCNEELKNILEDYCRKTGIKLRFRKTLPAVEKYRKYLMCQMER